MSTEEQVSTAKQKVREVVKRELTDEYFSRGVQESKDYLSVFTGVFQNGQYVQLPLKVMLPVLEQKMKDVLAFTQEPKVKMLGLGQSNVYTLLVLNNHLQNKYKIERTEVKPKRLIKDMVETVGDEVNEFQLVTEGLEVVLHFSDEVYSNLMDSFNSMLKT